MNTTYQNNEEIEFDSSTDEEQEDQLPITPNARILADQKDPEINSLYRRWKDGDLILQPDFQRQFVWDQIKSSRLIESVLLEIPLPVIYLSEEQNGKESVIDGQQRLTAFFSFIDGKFPNGKEFRMTGNTVFPALNRKSFKEIGKELQKKIKNCAVRTITFRRENSADLRFEVFERLNRGAVSLNEQELRNCVFRGPYNELLKELAQDIEFRSLLSLEQADPRMKDVELVLRFAAFHNSTYLKYKPPMKRFLNNDMAENINISNQKAQTLRSEFKKSVLIIKSLFAEHAFKRFYKGDDKSPNGRWEPKKFNTSLYDVLMNSFTSYDKNTVYQHLDSVREALLDLMTSDPEFIESIELSTSSVQAVRSRFDTWRFALAGIMGADKKEPRCFSKELKQQLYDSNPTCAICGNHIQHLDDAAVDHVEQYWKGGKTIAENARITHRYCNWARSRKD